MPEVPDLSQLNGSPPDLADEILNLVERGYSLTLSPLPIDAPYPYAIRFTLVDGNKNLMVVQNIFKKSMLDGGAQTFVEALWQLRWFLENPDKIPPSRTEEEGK